MLFGPGNVPGPLQDLTVICQGLLQGREPAQTPISACKVDVPEELDTLAMEKKLGELTPTEEFVAMLRVSLKQVLRSWLSRLTVGKHCLQGRV